MPPGTERVVLNGVGGAAEEITWQRYNGVRRSKFIPDADRDRQVALYEDHAGGGVALPHHNGYNNDMWTEITKDLVVKEALEMMGYEFEETEYFFYLMNYLRYVRTSLSSPITISCSADRYG